MSYYVNPFKLTTEGLTFFKNVNNCRQKIRLLFHMLWIMWIDIVVTSKLKYNIWYLFKFNLVGKYFVSSIYGNTFFENWYLIFVVHKIAQNNSCILFFLVNVIFNWMSKYKQFMYNIFAS